MSNRTRLFGLILCAFASTACASRNAADIPRPMTERQYLKSRKMMVPVHGVRQGQLEDTYNAQRSGGRAHLALDILRPRGTRVVAADGGVIRRIDTNPLGGRVIYIVDDAQRYVHYYAHLDQWARGLRVGDKVERGTYLGTVGTTGNAPANAPHLHYQLLRYRTDSRQWWSGEPVNPIPYLRRKGNVR
jgi:murein DD-endopeptidase MepM/ murein hydrolase activator NlpD